MIDSLLYIGFTAHYVYPIRVRFVNILTGRTGWMTIGYIPFIKPRHGKGSKAKRLMRMLRDELLQRCLAVILFRFAVASNDGVPVTLAQHGTMQAVPRIVLYVADQPEERHVLGLMLNGCTHPCSTCMTLKSNAGAAHPGWERRSVKTNLELQLEAALLFDLGEGGPRIKQIVKETSALQFVPFLGAVHGLGSGSCGLYRAFGFDILHVRLSALLVLVEGCGRRVRWTRRVGRRRVGLHCRWRGLDSAVVDDLSLTFFFLHV